MPAPAHVQASTLERFVDAWKRWNADDMLEVFADDFTQATLPFGMGVPDRERGAVEQVFPKLVGLVDDYKVRTEHDQTEDLSQSSLLATQLTVHEILHDAEKNKGVVYGISTGTTPFGPWAMGYATFLTFNEAGNRIARLEEILDSAFMKQFAPKFQQYLRELESRESSKEG
jgi:hypothetical protein